MISALHTATGGMLVASQSLDRQAVKIVKAGADAVERANAAEGAANPLSSVQNASDDLLTAVIDLTLIEANYAANAKVVETVDRLIGETLDILS